MRIRVLFIALFVLNIFQMSAQNNDEVTLVVSADGTTKEEATKVALRSAIEQAYGTFVSANTTILNDELVKDEIVTISSGNIKKYEEVSNSLLPDGRTYVTIRATVSISKLVSYAQKKGATTEFAGAAFAMDIKMKELNKQNELIAIKHMEEKLNSISNLFDFTLELETPEAITKDVRDETTNRYIKKIVSYKIRGKVGVFYNDNTELYINILFNTINALRLSEDEIKDYEQKNIPYYYLWLPFYTFVKGDVYRDSYWSQLRVNLRNDIENDYDVWKKVESAFIISDNISSPTKSRILFDFPSHKLITYYWIEKDNFFSLNNKKKIILKKDIKPGDKIRSFDIDIIIPQEDIGKYSKFTISSK